MMTWNKNVYFYSSAPSAGHTKKSIRIVLEKIYLNLFFKNVPYDDSLPSVSTNIHKLKCMLVLIHPGHRGRISWIKGIGLVFVIFDHRNKPSCLNLTYSTSLKMHYLSQIFDNMLTAGLPHRLNHLLLLCSSLPSLCRCWACSAPAWCCAGEVTTRHTSCWSPPTATHEGTAQTSSGQATGWREKQKEHHRTFPQ